MSINEGSRFYAMMEINPELAQEYRNHKKNCWMVIEEKKKQVSLIKEIRESGIFNLDSMIKMIKYRPVYCILGFFFLLSYISCKKPVLKKI